MLELSANSQYCQRRCVAASCRRAPLAARVDVQLMYAGSQSTACQCISGAHCAGQHVTFDSRLAAQVVGRCGCRPLVQPVCGGCPIDQPQRALQRLALHVDATHHAGTMRTLLHQPTDCIVSAAQGCLHRSLNLCMLQLLQAAAGEGSLRAFSGALAVTSSLALPAPAQTSQQPDNPYCSRQTTVTTTSEYRLLPVLSLSIC